MAESTCDASSTFPALLTIFLQLPRLPTQACHVSLVNIGVVVDGSKFMGFYETTSHNFVVSHAPAFVCPTVTQLGFFVSQSIRIHVQYNAPPSLTVRPEKPSQ